MAIDKTKPGDSGKTTGNCPKGGNHEWVEVNPGTKSCKKCKAIRKTG